MSAITTINVGNKKYSVRLTSHCQQRLSDREIFIKDIIKTLNKLDMIELSNLTRFKKEIALIDYEKEYTMIIAFKRGRINIITLLNGTDNYINEKTKIIELR